MTRRAFPALLWALIVCTLLAHNLYLWVGERISPDTDILALLPTERRDAILELASVRMIEAAQQQLIVLVGAAVWERARRAADAYTDTLARHGELFKLAEHPDQFMEANFLAPFSRHHEVLLTVADEAALVSQPAQFWIDRAMAKLYSPFSGPKLGPWQEDPFGLFSSWMQARAQETPVRPRDGKLFVGGAQRDYVVIPITVNISAFSIAAQQLIVPVLKQAEHAARSIEPQVEIVAAGVVLHAAAAGAQARREISTIGIGSMAGIILLIGLTFRSIKPIALIFVSIGIGCLGAVSACWLVFGKIHLVTLVFGASLVGVAQDYGIYFFCQRSATAELDSRRLLWRILPALILTLVTTLIGYLGLALTPFPGLRQMALFSITGLICAWLTVVLWFPMLVDDRAVKPSALADWCARNLTCWPILGRNRATVSLGAGVVVLAAIGGFHLGAQDNIRSLHNPPKKLLDDQIKLGELLDLPSPSQFFLLRGATPEIVLEREEILGKRLDTLIERRMITGYQAISHWVPSARLQTARRLLIQRALLSDDGALAALASQIGADREWVTAMRAGFITPAEPLTVNDFLRMPVSGPWRHLWLGKLGDGYASLVTLTGVNKGSLSALSESAGGLDGVQWVDKVGEISSLLRNYRSSMTWVLLLSYLTVYGLLYPRYGSVGWRTLAPTALASILTLTSFGIAGQGISLFHVLALMLLLGIGVDYGIFLQEQSRACDGAAWLSVALSALSTLLSFGLLGLSKTPALQAFGWTMAIGITSVCLIVPFFRKQYRQVNV